MILLVFFGVTGSANSLLLLDLALLHLCSAPRMITACLSKAEFDGDQSCAEISEGLAWYIIHRVRPN
jgi:hypothetical protein